MPHHGCHKPSAGGIQPERAGHNGGNLRSVDEWVLLPSDIDPAAPHCLMAAFVLPWHQQRGGRGPWR